jgi:alpha-2-macroglobulin
MKKSKLFTILGVIALIIIAAFLYQIRDKFSSSSALPAPPDPAFGKYISAFTAGVIPTDNSIEIRFAFDMIDSADVNTQLDQDVFRFRPRIDGQVYWKDKSTIEFRPSEKLPHDKKYSADFYISKLLNVPDEFKTFKFGFITMKQSAEFEITNIETYYSNQQPLFKITGVIKTADAAIADEVTKMVNLSSLPNHGRVEWHHSNRMRTHQFIINEIQRGKNPLDIELSWDASEIKSKDKGKVNINMPAPGVFTLVNTVVTQSPDPIISLQFSEPLNSNQVLAGLVYVEGLTNLRTRISGNEIKVFFPSQPSGSKVLFIEKAVQDINGNRLSERVVYPFQFNNINPSTRLVGKGVIMPASSGLLFPFEAVNLAAVDVTVVRVFENNIAQFFQVNQIDEDDQMRRVGRIVAKKTLSLLSSGTTNLNTWNRYTIDLSDIVLAEPGALYQVIIDFKKEYSVYPCVNGEEDSNSDVKSILTRINDEWEVVSDQVSYYGSYDEYNYYYYYDWSDRDDPCTESYYYNKSIKRNVLASDLGIIAKKDADGTMNVFITNLITARPISGVTVELYNFQQQIIESITTDKDGKATIKPRNKPYLLIAKKDSQRGYLRVDDGNSLSLSMFDVSGQSVQEGIKGFIYGERGVWRPGDTLFLTLIIEDPENRLPKGHPVVFELYNPLGQLVYSKVNNQGVNGFFHFPVATEEDDITGNWNSVYKIGGRSFSQSLKIETIMPNRLRIKIDFGDERLKVSDLKPVKLNSEWLHGATASNLRSEVNVTLNSAKTTFKGYEQYVFDDPSRPFYSETHTVFSGRLDGQGKASFSPNIKVSSSAPGILRASFETKVYEEGGAFSIDRISIPYLPYKSFAGIKTPKGERFSGMLYTDSIHNIDIICVDDEGKLIKNSKLKVDVYKVSWRWWWDSYDEYLGDFSSSSYNRPIQTKTFESYDGTSTFPFKIDYPEWGRYLVLVTDLQSGHRTGKTILIDWPSWYGSREGRQEAANMLSFTTDKDKYQTGEEIKFSFPSSEGGRALVSFENGTGVFKTFWVASEAETTTFTAKATAEMSPNFYAHISLLQKHGQTQNDLPIRLYGVVPILVEDPNTILKPVIKMPEILQPGEMVNIHISEENGKAMTYTLAMVDEGLLDLTRFPTPNAWKHFYAREALGVRSWDMYDYVLGAFGSEFARLLSIGGDDEFIQPVAGERATRFKPVVKYLGPYELKKGKSDQHSFKMPQYVGSVRVMVVAGQNGAYGSSEKTVPVKQSLMILGTLPRVLGPGETVKLPVNVFVSDPEMKNVSVTVSTNELLLIQGDKTQNVKFANAGDDLVFFNLKTAEKTGVARVKITAKSGNHTAEFDIELNVRNPNPEITEVVSFTVDPGNSIESFYKVVGIEGTNRATLEISSIPPLNLEKRLKYLTRYPHGCTEQILSAAFPQLFLGNLLNLSEAEQEKIQENIQSVITRVNARQLSNGGVALWPGSANADDWTTNYAGHFMLEAVAKGFAIPDGFINNWRTFQQQISNRWVHNTTFMGSDLMQAYRLYTLALSGAPELGAMNRMRELPNLSIAATWRLAAAYQLAGQSEAAKKLIENLSINIEPYTQTGYTYGSNQRDEAMIIETLTLMNRKGEAANLVKKLSEELATPYVYSTQTTSFALLAIAKFHGDRQPDAALNFSWKEASNSEKQMETKALIWQNELSVQELDKERSIIVKNNGNSTLFGRIIATGTPSAGRETASQNNLTMNVSYKDTKGNSISVADLKQGTTFIAEVTIGNPGTAGNYSQLALTQIFPSGWEISNTRMDASAAAVQSDVPEYQDVRDDRVYTYFNLEANRSKTFRIMLIATYEGEYYLPAFHVEAMYDTSIYANSAGRWVKVRR